MNVLAIVFLAFNLFLPFVGRTGTNVSVLVNSPCGPVGEETFLIVFKPGGETISGVTDEEGRWQYVGPEANFVEYYDNNVWFGKPAYKRSVSFHSWRQVCPTD